MKRAKGKTYIHYGTDNFNPYYMSFERWDKPGGLWASPINSDWGWKSFCKSADFRTENLKVFFKFRLQTNAKILKIKRYEEVIPYIIENDNRLELNLDKIKNEFDAMEVMMSNDWNNLHNSEIFWSWDVDSLVVWNLNKVMPITNKRKRGKE